MSRMSSRQLEEYCKHITRQFPAIETNDYDLTLAHEFSCLSRLGAGEIHRFIEHCLEHETAIDSLDEIRDGERAKLRN